MKMNSTTLQAALFFGLLWSPISLHAAEAEDAILSITLENDMPFHDRHYTHGTRISYLHREDRLPKWAAATLSRFPAGLETKHQRIGLALGQHLYTPADISTPLFQPNDRPYGGWLYAGLLLRRIGTEYNGAVTVWDDFEVDLGIVGEGSLAGSVQVGWHDLIDDTDPRGWDHQLNSEPGLMLQAARNYNLATPGAANGWGMDLTTTIGAGLGNVFTYARGGLMVRAGFDLPNDLGSSTGITPSFIGGPARETTRLGRFGGYVFVGLEGRAVARNIFLDGNTFSDSHSVDKEPLVADFRLGGALRYEWAHLSLAWVQRTVEFKTQPEANRFWSLSFAVRF